MFLSFFLFLVYVIVGGGRFEILVFSLNVSFVFNIIVFLNLTFIIIFGVLMLFLYVIVFDGLDGGLIVLVVFLVIIRNLYVVFFVRLLIVNSFFKMLLKLVFSYRSLGRFFFLII